MLFKNECCDENIVFNVYFLTRLNDSVQDAFHFLNCESKDIMQFKKCRFNENVDNLQNSYTQIGLDKAVVFPLSFLHIKAMYQI